MRKKWKWALFAVCLSIAAFVGYYAYSFYTFADSIHTEPEESRFKNIRTQTVTNTGEDLTPPKWEGKERVNILLLGGDSRGMEENEIPRSDSIMVASIDPVSKNSYLFSILRDTYVKIPNHGMERINSAITIGGPELAMKTASNLLGIPIQYYVYTDFKGFIALVDAMGGIDLDVEKDMKYSDSADGHEYDINLKKGYQHLDGRTALQYVRFRHDALSDFSRTERQRKFMKALAEELQSTTSLLKLPRILQSIDPYIETNLAVTQMIKLGSLGFEVKTSGLVSEQIPPSNLLEEKRVGGAEVIGVNPAKLQDYIRDLFAGDGGSEAGTKPGGGQLSMGGSTGKTEAAGKEPAPTARSTVKPTVKPSVKPTATPKASAKATVKPKPTPTPKKPVASNSVKPTATPKAGESGTNGAVAGGGGDGGGGDGGGAGAGGDGGGDSGKTGGGVSGSTGVDGPTAEHSASDGARSGGTDGSNTSDTSTAPASSPTLKAS